jgi:hypothetical protein
VDPNGHGLWVPALVIKENADILGGLTADFDFS